MADIWAGFPEATAETPRSGSSDPWAEFTPVKSGIAHNVMAGVNEAIADSVGAPVDIVNWASHHNPVSMAINAASRAFGYGDIDKTEAASEARHLRAPFGGSESIKRGMGLIGADPDSVMANSPGERLARSAGAGAAMVAAPEFAGRAAPNLISSAYRAVKGAATGAASGVGAEGAREVAPESLKPLASVVGGLVGGVAPGAALAGVRGGARELGFMSQASAERTAARRIADAASNPEAVRNSLGATEELVPGSRPTSFEATNDPGIGGLSREMERKYPAQFALRQSERNEARLAHLRGVQPEGDAADVGDYLRRTMQHLDDQHQQIVTGATENARASAERLGGNGPVDAYGASLRGSAQDAADRVRAQERGLWQAIDPRGDLTVNASPLKQAVKDVFGSVGSSARPLSSDERAIKDAVSNYGPHTPFRDVADLRSWVSDAMRQELRMDGNTQSYGRLARLRGAIEGAITSTAEMKAQQAPEEVRSGLEAYEQSLQQQADNWRAARRSGEQGYLEVQSGGASRVSPRLGTQGEGGGGFADNSGDQGILGGTAFDAEANARLKAATQATRDRVDTFNRGPVGQILRKDGRQDQYRLPDSAVAAKIFHPGPSGAEDVASYRRAVGDQKALVALQDYAASSLRQRAMRPDGTLDPARTQSWLKAHQNALHGFPDLQRRFTDAASASEAINSAMTARRAALDAYQTGALAKVMRASSADDATRTIGSILGSTNRNEQMQQLAVATARDPDARAGLRKGVADFMQSRFVKASGTEMKPDAFLNFLRQNRDTLKYVFDQKEVAGLNALAVDLLRSNSKSSIAAVSGPSLLKNLITEGAGAVLGGVSNMQSPLAGFLTAKVVNKLREAGITRVDEVVRDAMLNPDLAYSLLAKGKPSSTMANDLARALSRSSMATVSLALIGKTKPPARRESSPNVPAASNSRPGAVLDRYGISLSP
jgi:hypothetical protein